MVRRTKQPRDFNQYIDVRVQQLKEEMEKAHNPMDKQWFNRIISELEWARSPHHNCYMDKESDTDARGWIFE
jgi:hypothetical protein